MNSKTDIPTCQDDYDPNSLVMDEALRRIHDAITPIADNETVSVPASLDRIVATDVLSTINVPAYTNSAMDGYALKGTDLPAHGEARLKVVGKVFAGHPLNIEIGKGECARIMTGAPMPAGADTVVMQEHVQVEGNDILISEGQKAGQHVRQAGEDMAIGSVALPKGKRIIPADMGLIASLGIAQVSVKRRIKVAFFSTGDELRSLGETLEAGQIYDSNRYTLLGMLTRLGVELIDMGIIKDDQAAIEHAFKTASAKADVVITTGGVSVGEADFIKPMLEQLGKINFWKIAMKPGRPLTFGKVDQALFFGLPGNPVSAMVTFYQFVQPALRHLMGQPHFAPTSIKLKTMSKLKKAPGRVEFQRGIIRKDPSGEWMVQTTGHQGSHILSSMSQANCFIILPMETANVEQGEWVEVQPFEGII